MGQHLFFAAAFGLVVTLIAGTALADLVLLVPAEGQVPGKALTSTLARETRLVMVELGHQLVSGEQVEAAIRQVEDGRPDNADEYEMMAGRTNADWVVIPIIHPVGSGYRLEVIAYHSQTGRTESVSRDIDSSDIHRQVLEMARILLSPEGVGTRALPWEGGVSPDPPPTSSEPSPPPSAEAPTRSSERDRGSYSWQPLVGLTLGVAGAISRPDDASGGSTALQGGLRAGLLLASPFEAGLGLRTNMVGPKATSFDASVRYWVDVVEGVRVAPDVAAGAFFMGGGSQDTSLLIRFSGVAAVDLGHGLSVEGYVGDVTWVPASGGTLLLGGGTLAGIARF